MFELIATMPIIATRLIIYVFDKDDEHHAFKWADVRGLVETRFPSNRGIIGNEYIEYSGIF